MRQFVKFVTFLQIGNESALEVAFRMALLQIEKIE
jgi:hypothetical protein